MRNSVTGVTGGFVDVPFELSKQKCNGDCSVCAPFSSSVPFLEKGSYRDYGSGLSTENERNGLGDGGPLRVIPHEFARLECACHCTLPTNWSELVTATRDNSGRFVPGHRSNGGRPKGFAGVARMILTETRDGAELVEFALETLRNEENEMRDRLAAHSWLSDRGLGKPLQSLELHGVNTPATPVRNFDSLPLERRRELLAQLRAVPELDVANGASPINGDTDA